MIQHRELWKQFVKATSYRRILKEQGISNDQFWMEYAPFYEEIQQRSGYPGEILERVSSLIPTGSTLLDVGAGTGAFAIPLASRMGRVLALDPSTHQLRILEEKAGSRGINNITLIHAYWETVDPRYLGDVDFSLAAYSMFVEDLHAFLQKMITVSAKGVFLVFRAGRMDPLQEFAYGTRPEVDHTCLVGLLEEMGYNFQVEVFHRDYTLPLHCILHSYRFSPRSGKEITRYLRETGRFVAPKHGFQEGDPTEVEDPMVRIKSDDALLHRLC